MLGKSGAESLETATIRRTIKLPKLAVSALKRRPRAGTFVFCTSKGTAIKVCNPRNRVWKPLLKRTGRPSDAHIHALCRFAITLLSSHRVPVNAVSDMTGHGNPAITLTIYATAGRDAGRGRRQRERYTRQPNLA